MILPWVCEHPRIEHCIYIGAVHIYFFEILFVHSVTYNLGFIENIVVMEVLISCFWEDLALWTNRHLHGSSCLVHLCKHQSVIHSVHLVPHSLCFRTEQILWHSLRI